MTGGRVGLWLRWSWRDLRARWLQVAAIAVIIAIGAGVYAALSSQTVWRRDSYTASYEVLDSHDFTITTADGTFADEGTLRDVVDGMEHPEWVTVAEERLVGRTQVDASALSDDPLLVPGRIVGVDVGDGGPDVDSFEIETGRALTEADAGEPVVVLDSHFADHHDLPGQGELQLSSGPVDYVGTGYTPEYFVVSTETTTILAESGFGVLFAPLATAQELLGSEGQVNELALRLAEGVDPEAAQAELEAATARSLPELATEVTWLEDERVYRRLFDDIENDQKLFNIFAFLILGGAAFAAFNLTGRIVEAQRREIGVGMALGLPRWKISVRPLLVGLQIALLGVVVGMGFGLLLGRLMSSVNLELVPLPIWDDSFQPAIFFRGALLALGLTFLATVYPVWRAVRVDPIDAIHTRPGITKGGGLAPLLHRIPLPGNSIHQFPFRDVVRAPRRTLLTAFGIAAAIAVLVALFGMLDSFLTTIDDGEEEILGDAPDRATVSLAARPGIGNFYLASEPEVQAITETEGVAAAEPRLSIGGQLIDDDGEEIETFLSFIDFDGGVWAPTILEGSLETDEPAVALSRKAADDLGVGPGDTVTLRHPLLEEGTEASYSFVESEVPVAAVHPNPYRFFTYLDIEHADLMNLDGVVNEVSVVPEEGVTTADLKEELFGQPGVAAVEGVTEVASTIRDTLEDFLGFLTVIQGFVLLMAVLIAFNSTSISSDERRREHATMFAFGLPVRTVMTLTIIESFLIGVLATIVGVVVGRALITWVVRVLLTDTVPDLFIQIDVSAQTYLTAALLGVVAVALAPLLTVRRLRRMDIPSTLRVVE